MFMYIIDLFRQIVDTGNFYTSAIVLLSGIVLASFLLLFLLEVTQKFFSWVNSYFKK